MTSIEGQRRRRRVAAATTILAALALSVPASAEAAPGGNRVTFTGESTTVVTDLCEFPVTIDSTADLSRVSVETARGTLTYLHATETDVFSANGVSLTSETYRFNLHYLDAADGTPLRAVSNGVLLRVPLPDGSTFFLAGRSDFVETQEDFGTTVDSGVSKNVDAFCDALAG